MLYSDVWTARTSADGAHGPRNAVPTRSGCSFPSGVTTFAVARYPAIGTSNFSLALRPDRPISGSGVVNVDFTDVDFTDVAPTLLDVAGVDWVAAGMAPAAARSWREVLQDHGGTARTVPPRDHVLVGKERHDVGRPGDVGYPIRGMVKGGFLYLRNYEPGRWPACNPETGYLNCDASPTKTLVLQGRRRDPADVFWALCFGKHPAEELYDLAADPAQADRRVRMEREMSAELTAQGDPRTSGRGDVFDQYPIANEEVRNFYERHQRGEKVKAGWADAGGPAAPRKEPAVAPGR